jgi:hypothetical protein
MPDSQDFTVADIPNIPDSEFPSELKIRTEMLLIRYGQGSFKKTFEYMKQFQVGEALQDIKVPCLAMIGASETGEPMRQFKAFCEVTGADSFEFTDFQGAGSHCQVGNPVFANAVMYDWLDNL